MLRAENILLSKCSFELIKIKLSHILVPLLKLGFRSTVTVIEIVAHADFFCTDCAFVDSNMIQKFKARGELIIKSSGAWSLRVSKG